MFLYIRLPFAPPQGAQLSVTSADVEIITFDGAIRGERSISMQRLTVFSARPSETDTDWALGWSVPLSGPHFCAKDGLIGIYT